MSDTNEEWRRVMYADEVPTHSGTVISTSRNNSQITVPSLEYVQRLEKTVIHLNTKLNELEKKISNLEMLSRTTRDAVRKNASVLEGVSKELDGKQDSFK